MYTAPSDVINNLQKSQKELFQERKTILSFEAYLEELQKDPVKLSRNAPAYLKDMFDYYESYTPKEEADSVKRYKIFDTGTPRTGKIVGCEAVQKAIYSQLASFVRIGYSNKLLLLHGPNGSAKTSTIEAISYAMQDYSTTDDGAVYTFSWIFPLEKSSDMRVQGESGPIGFAGASSSAIGSMQKWGSYAYLDETKIASKIYSEFKDNPIYLLPLDIREEVLREWIAKQSNLAKEDVEIPQHVMLNGLSKKNQLIFDTLLSAYGGDVAKVLRHVQVERFFYSRQYRVGISTVEPQMSVDAHEKQLTMDKNIANLPTVLHNIRFHEAQGEVVEANRGILEFSDMLKRPLDAFKYLLTTVEKGTMNLPSSTAQLDIVYFGTTNEKHLDAFKTMPDFPSFRSRFELITVPYLLSAKKEKDIYQKDVRALSKFKTIAPHSLELLCKWAVMTRFKQPDPEYYDTAVKSLVSRLDPRTKLKLYDRETLGSVFKGVEENQIKELRSKVMRESVGMVVYEGRFGASPRELRAILQKAAQNVRHKTLTPMAIFEELELLVRDRSVYEFLQFEPRGKYHDAAGFIQVLKDEFCEIYEKEVFGAMTLVDDQEYDRLLQRYIQHVVASVKKERIQNPLTNAHEPPSETLMHEVEKILGITGSVDRYREGLLGRIAAYKIDNPSLELKMSTIFHDLHQKLQDHYSEKRTHLIKKNYEAMLKIAKEDFAGLRAEDRQLAESSYEQLEKKYGYDRISAQECLKFVMMVK